MPFGLINAMAVWSRFIESVMENYLYQCVMCYADDCLVYTKTDNIDDHLRDVEKIFDQLHKFGIKIKASKLKIALKEIPFLGVVLQESGMIPNKEKTKAISQLEPPTTIGQLRRVLGIFAYYRKFIAKFSEIAAPLYALTGEGAQTRHQKNKGIEMTEV